MRLEDSAITRSAAAALVPGRRETLLAGAAPGEPVAGLCARLGITPEQLDLLLPAQDGWPHFPG